MRRLETPLPEFIVRQRLRNLRLPLLKQGGHRQRCLARARRRDPCKLKKRGTNKQRLNSSLPKQIKTSLGPEREALIAPKEKEIEEK